MVFAKVVKHHKREGIVMPARNGTGPQGTGPMTGWGMGNCVVENPSNTQTGQPSNVGLGRGLGRGRGIGMGRGLGRGRGLGMGQGFAWQAQGAQGNVPALSVDALKQQAKMLEQELDSVKKQIQSSSDQK